MTQYFDTLKEIGGSAHTNAIFIPHSPGILPNLSDQIRNAMLEANPASTCQSKREALAVTGNGK